VVSRWGLRHPEVVDDPNNLSREELLEIIRELRRQNERLKTEIERLKKKLSAAPFAKGSPKKNPKRPGRKPGQGPFARRPAPPQGAPAESIRVPVEEPCCPFCGGPWGAPEEELVSNTDLPVQPPPEVQTFLVEKRCCQRCGKTVRGRHSAVAADQYGATAHRVGARAKAVAHTLHYGMGVPQRKVPRIMKELSGLEITQGALSQDAQKQTAGVVGAAYQQLRAEIPSAPVVNTDDTGWRVGGQAAQLMVFTTPEITVYQVRRQHRNEEVREVIGDDFQGILGCDRGKSYDAEELDRRKQQKCFSHLIRNTQEVESRQSGRALQFPRQLRERLREGLDLAHRRLELGEQQFQQKVAELDQALDDLLLDRTLRNRDNQRLLDGIGAQHDRNNLLRFLSDPRVEPTNNRAERALRPAVIRRKVSQCSKTESGARAFEVFLSVLQTYKQRSPGNVSQSLFNLFTTSGSTPPS
jgi:transposase